MQSRIFWMLLRLRARFLTRLRLRLLYPILSSLLTFFLLPSCFIFVLRSPQSTTSYSIEYTVYSLPYTEQNIHRMRGATWLVNQRHGWAKTILSVLFSSWPRPTLRGCQSYSLFSTPKPYNKESLGFFVNFNVYFLCSFCRFF
jgi:hypothetical protein